jgi:hypothetical protein
VRVAVQLVQTLLHVGQPLCARLKIGPSSIAVGDSLGAAYVRVLAGAERRGCGSIVSSTFGLENAALLGERTSERELGLAFEGRLQLGTLRQQLLRELRVARLAILNLQVELDEVPRKCLLRGSRRFDGAAPLAGFFARSEQRSGKHALTSLVNTRYFPLQALRFTDFDPCAAASIEIAAHP